MTLANEGECRCCGEDITPHTLTGLCAECFYALVTPMGDNKHVMCTKHGVKLDPKHDR